MVVRISRLTGPERIILGREGETFLLMGNEAVARGAFEAGVGYVSTYPGTPVSEIGNIFSEIAPKIPGLYFQLSVNEATAIQGAAGASWSGVKALTVSKHVGLNVASDSFITICYNGCNSAYGEGGLILVSGDDPGALGSQNEQNNRFYGPLFNAPIIEPSTPQEAKDFIVEAYKLSNQYDIPIIYRLTTRIAHSRGKVTYGPILEKPKEKGYFKKDIPKFCSLPPHANRNKVRLIERINNIEKEAAKSKLNRTLSGKGEIGIVTSGAPYGYTVEALNLLDAKNTPVLKLGITYPVSRELFTRFVQEYNLEKIIVVEEMESFLETQLKKLAHEQKLPIEIIGKEIYPPYGELSTGDVALGLTKILGKEPKINIQEILQKHQEKSKIIPARTPTFCPGCPERAILYAIRKATKDQAIYGGDIGCYVMSFFPPIGVTDWIVCMSGGLGVANGMSFKTDQDIIALMGDSTFYHTGIPTLINSVYNDANVLLVILDNKWTAMTGHQPHPGSGIRGMGEKSPSMPIEDIVKAIGVKYIRIVDPFEVNRTITVLTDALRQKGPRVVISRRECMLTYQRRIRKEKTEGPKLKQLFWIVPGRCQLCLECVKVLGCTAIRKVLDEEYGEETMFIDQSRCTQCGVCKSACRHCAIARTSILQYS
ncbi:MAG: indolepyruvate ferredoxin oxidoreductase subunit alpha [Candidatus Jordarchaeaceae archaeon]